MKDPEAYPKKAAAGNSGTISTKELEFQARYLGDPDFKAKVDAAFDKEYGTDWRKEGLIYSVKKSGADFINGIWKASGNDGSAVTVNEPEKPYDLKNQIAYTTGKFEGVILVEGTSVYAGMAVEAAVTTAKVGKVVQYADDVVEGTINTAQKLSRESVINKLDRYLLNPEHPVGGSKAKWFDEALGFNKSNMDNLANQIVFDPTKAVQTGVTEFGTKYNQVISVTGANGKTIDVTFAWIKNNDEVVRLVTGIPTKK